MRALLVLVALVPVCLSAQEGWRKETGPGAWTNRAEHNSEVFNNRIVTLIGSGYGPRGAGYVYDQWSSFDGVSWNEDAPLLPFGGANLATALSGGKLWVLGTGSSGNGVVSTIDGVSWVQETSSAPWGRRQYHTAVALNGRLWLLGGVEEQTTPSGKVKYFRNDVWSSTDGINWVQEVAAANWSGRASHVTVVFDNRMWVIGGWNGQNRLRDVWSSSDGVTWTLATATSPWNVREYYSAAVFNERIWIAGGWDGLAFKRYNDVWSSTDGINWSLETGHAPWAPRSDHTSFVFKNRLWIFGGASLPPWPNDAWSYGLHIAPGKLPSGVLQVPYARDLEARLGTGPFDWSVIVGSLPPGLALGTSTSGTVTVSGTPEATGTFQFGVRVEDQGTGDWAEESITLTIKPQFSNKDEAQASACTATPNQAGKGGQGASTAVLWLAWLAALTAATITLRHRAVVVG